MRNVYPYFFLFIFYFNNTFSQSIDDLGIHVSTTDRQFVFTNKEAGTYHGEVNASNAGGWQGWFINAEKIVHDYSIIVNDTMLDRNNARSVVFPHQVQRYYPNGIREVMTLLDSNDILLIEVNNSSAKISLRTTDNFQLDTLGKPNELHWKRTNPASEIVPTEIIITRSIQHQSTVFAIAAGRTTVNLRSISRTAAIDPEPFITKRKTRMQAVLRLSPTTTSSKELTTAIAWAKLQVDALIMNQSIGGARTKGIFAGLPWFNNYWGRDSFISLPGATYVIGNFIDARDVLRSYAAFQELDTTSTNYGRIPNLATPQSVIYNTADGAPWFVRSLLEYVQYSGDTDFVREMYPVVVRSIDGTLKYHCDSLGFLTHTDAESWMDAVGPDGPWSPRGNRANDIQALWHQQLTAGIFFAKTYNKTETASRWKIIADKLETNFSNYFVDTANGLIYDHLTNNGTPSVELRPNQLFTLDMLMPESIRRSVVNTVLNELVFEHGTATLAQNDSNFHPHHEFPPYYVKDAAYHNGTVWTWLNGAAVHSAVRYDLQDVVYPITMNSVHQMLHRGTVGALSELLDAHPRRKNNGTYDEPKLSGTYSQAWSLAEFVRSVYQEYFGFSTDVLTSTIRIHPHLPSALTSTVFEQRVENGSVTVSYQRTGDKINVTVTPNGLRKSYSVDYRWTYKNGNAVVSTAIVNPGIPLSFEHTATSFTIIQSKKRTVYKKNDPKVFLKHISNTWNFAAPRLATPDLNKKFRVLRGPSYPLLTHTTVKAQNRLAHLLAETTDPGGDDTGIPGSYQYPTSQHFKKGILDITGASFRYDSMNLYCRLTFSELYDPGWHPEYGFQLTLAAIAINTGGGTERFVGANARYTLDSSRAYDKLILVGGGVRIINAAGTILCEYIPRQEDAADPIGNVRNRSIEFAVPLEYLGAPHNSWKISVLVGAQDDHGGAGIGEFRTIQQEVTEWLGGGNNNPNDSNVYDVMMIH
ncbi:MAG: amylo-alpha-1,6-glucosidase [Bacteriovoracaceae bacterium]|nr:hypothetical protein [Bacteroidota bacterium]